MELGECYEIHTSEQIEPVATFTACKTYGGDWNVRENTAVAYIETKEPAVTTRAEIEANAGTGVYTYIPDTHRCNPPTFPYPPTGAKWQCMALNDAEDFCRKEWVLGSDLAWRERPENPLVYRPDYVSSETYKKHEPEIEQRAIEADKFTKLHCFGYIMLLIGILCIVVNIAVLFAGAPPFHAAFIITGLINIVLSVKWIQQERAAKNIRLADHQKWLSEILSNKPLPPTGRGAASFTDYDG